MRMITPSLGRPLATILALGLLLPSVAMSDTLAGALSGAYDHSGLLDQNRALLRAADEDVAAATAALRPVLSYSLSSNYSTLSASTSSNLSLTASLVLFDFGAGQLRRDLARENVMSLRAALRGVEQNVLLGAVVAYTSMQRDGAIVELRTNNVRVIERELQAARDRFEVGEITRTDVALAEARLASARAALAAARGDLDRSREDYRASVGTYPGSLSALPPAPEVPNSLDAARALARQRHPDMAQAQRAVAARGHGGRDECRPGRGGAETGAFRLCIGRVRSGQHKQRFARPDIFRRHLPRRRAGLGAAQSNHPARRQSSELAYRAP